MATTISGVVIGLVVVTVVASWYLWAAVRHWPFLCAEWFWVCIGCGIPPLAVWGLFAFPSRLRAYRRFRRLGEPKRAGPFGS